MLHKHNYKITFANTLVKFWYLFTRAIIVYLPHRHDKRSTTPILDYPDGKLQDKPILAKVVKKVKKDVGKLKKKKSKSFRFKRAFPINWKSYGRHGCQMAIGGF